MIGFRVVRYSGNEIIGISEWKERQQELSSLFDRWTVKFKWQCVVLDDNQLRLAINGQR